MSKTLDFWFDYASPYSYLASVMVEGVAERSGAQLRWRPFLLGGVYKQLGVNPLENNSAARLMYMGTDLTRCAAKLGVPVAMPEGWPALTVAPLRLTLAAPEDQRGALAKRIFSAYFADGSDIRDKALLTRIVEELGLDAGLIEASGTPEGKKALIDETQVAFEAGVFGSPSFVVEGELFWGHDRLDQVEDQLRG